MQLFVIFHPSSKGSSHLLIILYSDYCSYEWSRYRLPSDSNQSGGSDFSTSPVFENSVGSPAKQSVQFFFFRTNLIDVWFIGNYVSIITKLRICIHDKNLYQKGSLCLWHLVYMVSWYYCNNVNLMEFLNDCRRTVTESLLDDGLCWTIHLFWLWMIPWAERLITLTWSWSRLLY